MCLFLEEFPYIYAPKEYFEYEDSDAIEKLIKKVRKLKDLRAPFKSFIFYVGRFKEEIEETGYQKILNIISKEANSVKNTLKYEKCIAIGSKIEKEKSIDYHHA